MEDYFGDGGRNLFALFMPLPLLFYSTLLWGCAWALEPLIWRGPSDPINTLEGATKERT